MTREQLASALISPSAGDAARTPVMMASLVLSVIPYLGLLVLLVALIRYRRRLGGWRIAAIIGFIISSVATLLAILLSLLR
jgi:hypothetical protein